MISRNSVFILIYLAVVLHLELTAATPLPPNKVYERSVNPPIAFKVPAGSNYLDNSINPDSQNFALRDVHGTIAQVQKILESDPTLPRLTRGEIEDLFEEVTKEEYEKSIQAGDLSRAKHMRALMLVLPFNANHTSSNDLQELYNRPPITKVISNEPKEEKKQKIVIPSGKVEIVNVNKQDPTTYKPSFRIKPLKTIPDPTTYHPKPTTVRTITTDYFVTPTPRTTTTTITSTPLNSPIFAPSFEGPQNRFSSHYSSEQSDFDSAPFKPIPTNSKPIDPELEEILKSLGFSAQSQSKKRFKLDEPPPEELSKRMLSSTIRKDDLPEPFAFLPAAPTISAQDFTKGLSPSISPRDFGTFKPIPEASGEVPADLETYLKKFGLFPPFESRSQKALRESLTKISDRIDVNVGDEDRKDTSNPEFKKNTFKPSDTDEEDYKKLQELLKTLQELQRLNSTLNKDALEKLDPRYFNLSETLLAQGPNPILENELDLSKNEIKRQTESPEPTKYSLDLNVDETNQPAETTTPTTASETTTESNSISNTEIDKIFVVTPEPNFKFPATTATTTTEEAPRNNAAELGDSFAGGLGDAENAEPLPPPRRNGFYFLSDWNSFLEVGEDPDKIIVRFDPKVGDPSRFIPVNVP